jgi:Mg-chelatase subunit ChlD
VASILPTIYSGPLRVLLLIDSSGSMAPPKGGTGSGIALPTAAFAMDAVPSNAAVAVGRFAERLLLSQWQDRDSAREQISSLKYQSPKGQTALYASISEASSIFRGSQFGDTIYLITDGGDNHSATDSRRLIENLIARGIRVFAFLINNKEPFKTPEELEGRQVIEDLASLTGGALLTLPWSQEWISTGEAATAARQLREEVASPYQIDFQLQAPLSKSAKLKLESPNDPKRYSLAYPRRLEPCAAESKH